MTASLASNTHKLGLKGHFVLAEHLQDIALAQGLTINADRQGGYSVAGGNVDRLCPSFIERKGNQFDLPQLKKFLEFLHQPVRVSLEHVIPEFRAKQALSPTRLAVHQVARLLTTGSVRAPKDIYGSLENNSDVDHARTERAMRDEDDWLANQEIGNPRLSQSSIPGSHIDPARGFIFARASDRSMGEAHAALSREMRALVKKAAGFSSPVEFTADEFIEFVNDINEKLMEEEGAWSLSDLLVRAAFEEDVQDHLRNIDRRMYDLASSAAFQKLQQGDTTVSKLQELLSATTALTPVVKSAAMHEIWRRYHFSERKESTLADFGRQLEVFQQTVRLHSQSANIPALQAEAIAQEFYPLLATAARMSEILQQGLNKTTDRDAWQGELATRFCKAAETFRHASVAGVALDPKFMDDGANKMVDALARALGEDRSAVTRIIETGAATFRNFVGDIVNFTRENPYAVPVCAALVAALYISKGGSAAAAQAVVENAVVLTDQGFQAVTVDTNSLPAEALKSQNWHWNFGPLGPYKHFAFDNVVKGVAEVAIDWARVGTYWAYQQAGIPVNVSNQFFANASETITPVADQLFGINLLQNASHAGFWMYVGSKGYQHGFKGAGKIVEFMSPIADLGYQAWTGTKDMMLRHRKDASVSSRLLGLTQNIPADDAPDRTLTRCNQHRCLMFGLAKAAEARAETERGLPADIRSGEGIVKIGGIKHVFRISSENLGAVLKALNQFDLVVSNIAGQADMAQPFYQKFLAEKLDAVTSALKRHQEAGNDIELEDVLSQNLAELLAAQSRYAGGSSIYTAIFGLDPDVDVAKRLHKEGRTDYRDLKAADSIASNRQRLTATNLPLKERAGLHTKIIGTIVWNGMIDAAAALGRGIDKVATKPAAIATAGLTAAAIALDVAGSGNSLTSGVSAIAGQGAAALLTTGIFGAWNTWDDMILNHIGGGAVLLVAGAASGYAFKKVIRPLAMSGMESLQAVTGIDLRQKWAKAGDTKPEHAAPAYIAPQIERTHTLHQIFPVHAREPVGACMACTARPVTVTAGIQPR